jgi:hypothetical protein
MDFICMRLIHNEAFLKLIPWCRMFREKLIVTELSNKPPVLMEPVCSLLSSPPDSIY